MESEFTYDLKLVSANLFPEADSQMITFPPEPPEAIYFPSALQVMAVTSFESASSDFFISPVAASQIFTVLSDEPVAINFPSGLNPAPLTALACFKVKSEPPLFPSQIFAEPSLEAVTI